MRSSIYKRTNMPQNSTQQNQKSEQPQKRVHQQKQGDSSIVHQNSVIQQFLGMRRITKDKCCLIIFLLYCLGLAIMLGIGFFYGNYHLLGVFINGNSQDRVNCTQYVNQQLTQCIGSCASNYTYLGRICINQDNMTNYNPNFDNQVNGLISMYDIKYTFNMITYTSAGLLGVSALFFFAIIYIPQIIYFFVSSLFFMLLGMAFYLLKNVQIRIQQFKLSQNSVFRKQEEYTRTISFLLLGIYLLIFPFVLFSPKKIKLGVQIIQKLKQFYLSMVSMIFFSFVVIAIVWGTLILWIFLVMHFYTSGTIQNRTFNTMFYTFDKIELSNPASLVFFFIGIFWLYSTIISWHKYFVSSSMCLWYFQDGQSLYPVKRGLRRSLHHIGSAAIDGILMPIQWILLLIYSVLKTHNQEEQSCANGCFQPIRQFFMKIYNIINRGSPSSAVLTNQTYFQSCTNSAETFLISDYRFFNIGGTLTIFLTLFVCIFWVIIIYFIVYGQILSKAFPPLISSAVLPVFCVFIIGLITGSLFANIYTSSLDCLLYCYLTQRKNSAENNGELQRSSQQLKIKTFLDEYYYKSAEQKNSTIYIYQQLDENTLELNYISKKQ